MSTHVLLQSSAAHNEFSQQPIRSEAHLRALNAKDAHSKLVHLLEFHDVLRTAHTVLDYSVPQHRSLLEFCQAVRHLQEPLIAYSRTVICAYHAEFGAAEAAYQHAVAEWEVVHGTLY